jgi:uncharacterized protein
MNIQQSIFFRDFGNANIKNIDLVVGIPEVGLVGVIASSYIIEKLNLKEAGAFDSDLMPPVFMAHQGVPKYPIRLYTDDRIGVLISEIPFSSKFSNEFGKYLASWSKERNVRSIIGITGIPSRNRILGQDNDISKVFFLTNHKKLYETYRQSGAETFEEGIIVGSLASLLKYCVNFEQPAVVLLAESYLDFPDPGAAASIIKVLNNSVSLGLDVKPLIEESEEIRLRNRELMKRTQQAMQQAAQTIPSVYR